MFNAFDTLYNKCAFMQKLLFGQLLEQNGGLDKTLQDLDALSILVLLYFENILFLTC